jgi:hypothetical protein
VSSAGSGSGTGAADGSGADVLVGADVFAGADAFVGADVFVGAGVLDTEVDCVVVRGSAVVLNTVVLPVTACEPTRARVVQSQPPTIAAQITSADTRATPTTYSDGKSPDQQVGAALALPSPNH